MNILELARVSTAAQCRDGNSLEDQVAALVKYGCQEIVKEAFCDLSRTTVYKYLSLLDEKNGGCNSPHLSVTLL